MHGIHHAHSSLGIIIEIINMLSKYIITGCGVYALVN